MSRVYDYQKKTSDFIRQNSILQNFTKNSWCILNPIEQSIKAKIEKIGVPLKDWDIKIYRGILTGCNEAFIIDGATKDALIAQDPKSAEIIRPILRGRDIKRYSYKFADKWLIYVPWHFPLHKDTSITGASKKAEHEFEKQYPAIYNRLLSYKPILEKRNKAETGIRYEWYALQRCAATYMDDFSKQVIAWQRITQKPTFCLTENGLVVLDSMAFLSNIKDKYKNWLLAVLNSDLIYFWVKTNVHEYGNTGFRLSNQYVEQISIPFLSETEMKQFIDIYGIDQYSDKKIQDFIYKIYDISTDEQLFIKSTIQIRSI